MRAIYKLELASTPVQQPTVSRHYDISCRVYQLNQLPAYSSPSFYSDVLAFTLSTWLLFHGATHKTALVEKVFVTCHSESQQLVQSAVGWRWMPPVRARILIWGADVKLKIHWQMHWKSKF